MNFRIVHDMNPIAWRIAEDLGVRWFALIAALGFLVLYWTLRRAGRRGEILGLSAERIELYMLFLIGGFLLGARAFHVFLFDFSSYGFDPPAWVALWRGGLSTQGGMLGAFIATALYCRRAGLDFYAIADRLVVPVALCLALSRIGDFINASGVGTPYEGPFCVDYSQSRFIEAAPIGCRHPTTLYQASKDFLIASVLLPLSRRRNLPAGTALWAFVLLYGAIRFPLMFLRDEQIALLGLSMSSWLSALMILLGATMLARTLWVGRRHPTPATQDELGRRGAD